jgi:NTP pyrophosphatase (non-canonical NTP hydrolase)
MTVRLPCSLTQNRKIYETEVTYRQCVNIMTEEEISIRTAQRLVDEWIRTTGVRYFNELTNMAILTEEVGEVARLMSRIYGDQSFREADRDKKLSDELADVLWVVLCIANQTGTDLTEALQRNFGKKNIRDATRHLENPKLDRKQSDH